MDKGKSNSPNTYTIYYKKQADCVLIHPSMNHQLIHLAEMCIYFLEVLSYAIKLTFIMRSLL